VRLWLDSADPSHPASDASWVAEDADVIYRWREGKGDVSTGGHARPLDGNPWEALKALRAAYPGWWGGYIGYDVKNATETLHSRNPDLIDAPDLLFARFRQVRELESGRVPDWQASSYRCGPLRNRIVRCDYEAAVIDAKRRIREGDLYEVNLSHPLFAAFDGDPLALYRRLREHARVPFGAFLQDGDFAVACASPERFLRVQDRILRSDPIKGTSPRGADPVADQSLKAALADSAKNRAENLMIVDLVRHDLSRVCLPGSVVVRDLFGIQTFATVHQMVSVVEGRLDPGVDVVDAIKACFPMGSMTGAPKIAAMRHIESLESWRRGVYSGAIGMIGPDGDAQFNVVIRSALIRGETLVYGVGGAITSDSDPAQEWEETVLKARVLADLIGLEIPA
jgi:para-aminobenzoate synthetase component 1